MTNLKRIFPCIVLLASLVLTGCGGSTTTDPNSSIHDPLNPGGKSVGGAILFTDSAGLQPGTQINMLTQFSRTVNPAITPSFADFQPIPFLLTDSSGKPRVGVNVTLSVSTISAGSILSPTVLFPGNTLQQTVQTDGAGMGVFNATIILQSPPLNSLGAATVVFEAQTNDQVPVTAYAGQGYQLTSSAATTLTLTPSTQSFTGAALNATRTFTISGGSLPYNTPTSSDTSLVTVSLSGNTLTATYVDATLATPWATPVTVTVSDSSGQLTSATLTRQ